MHESQRNDFADSERHATCLRHEAGQTKGVPKCASLSSHSCSPSPDRRPLTHRRPPARSSSSSTRPRRPTLMQAASLAALAESKELGLKLEKRSVLGWIVADIDATGRRRRERRRRALEEGPAGARGTADRHPPPAACAERPAPRRALGLLRHRRRDGMGHDGGQGVATHRPHRQRHQPRPRRSRAEGRRRLRLHVSDPSIAERRRRPRSRLQRRGHRRPLPRQPRRRHDGRVRRRHHRRPRHQLERGPHDRASPRRARRHRRSTSAKQQSGSPAATSTACPTSARTRSASST